MFIFQNKHIVTTTSTATLISIDRTQLQIMENCKEEVSHTPTTSTRPKSHRTWTIPHTSSLYRSFLDWTRLPRRNQDKIKYRKMIRTKTTKKTIQFQGYYFKNKFTYYTNHFSYSHEHIAWNLVMTISFTRTRPLRLKPQGHSIISFSDIRPAIQPTERLFQQYDKHLRIYLAIEGHV